MTALRTGVAIRPMTDADEPAVLELLRASLGQGPTGNRSAEFFRWKHRTNPFGPSPAWVAELDEEIVGLRTFMRWRFERGAGNADLVRAARAVDTATRPDMQGRGIFRELTTAAAQSLRHDTDLIFNTPNAASGAGYLRMGWSTVGRVPVSVRVAHPARFARGARRARSAPPDHGNPPGCRLPAARTALEDPRLPGLLEQIRAAHTGSRRLTTPRTLDYLNWRYAQAPGLDYRAAAIESGGVLRGVIVGRARARGTLRELTVCELLVEPADRRTAARLVGVAARSGPDHVTAHLDRRTAGLAAGLLPAPGAGLTLMTRPLRPLRPDPLAMSSWHLSLGDLELF